MASNGAIIIPPRTNAAAGMALTNDIRDIKPPVKISNPWETAAWIGGGVLLVALMAILVWWLIKRRPAAQPVIVPPHVRARERIDAALALINNPREFCIALSDAMRVYLEERFQLRAPERTTEEFLHDLQATSHLNADQKQTLADFLSRCDLVKFARFEPNEGALRELHEVALRLVHETQYETSQEAAGASAEKSPKDENTSVK